jgi:outer membrane receptor protein involved in Fe transport
VDSARQPANEEEIVRATLMFAPNDKFGAKLKLQGGRFRSNTDTAASQSICGPGISLPTGSGAPDPTGDCQVDGYRSSSAIPSGLLVNWPNAKDHPYTSQDSVLTALTMDYATDRKITFTSVTGYFDIDQKGFDDFTSTSVGRVWSTNLEHSKQLSQELRAVTQLPGALNYTVGAYYENADRTGGAQPMAAYLRADPATGRYFTFDRYAETKGETISVFAQLRWKLTDALELAGGARYTSEEKTTKIGNLWVHPALAASFLAPGKEVSGRFADSNVSPEVTIAWHPADDALVFAAYRTGYKSGGFSNSTVTAIATADNQRFGSERARGVELGYKGYLADHRARIEAAVYQYKFLDLQQVSYDPTTLTQLIRNAAQATSRGAELNGVWHVGRGWGLHAGLGYNDATFDSFTSAPCYIGQTVAQGCVSSRQDLSGRQLSRAPKWSNQLGVGYSGQVTSSVRFELTADASYTSSYAASDNQNPIGNQDAFWLVASSLRFIGGADNKWEVGIIGQNLTNKYYKSIAFDKSGGAVNQIATTVDRPRQVALQATVRF